MTSATRMEASVSMAEPTPHELERRLDREMKTLSNKMDEGFSRVEQALERLQFVNPDVFQADQRRQDQSIDQLRREFGALHVQVEREVGSVEQATTAAKLHFEEQTTKVRNQFVGGLLVVLVVSVFLTLITPPTF